MVVFNPEIHYLGKLCRHGHEFEDSGLSVRYKKSRRCICCGIAKEKKIRQSSWMTFTHEKHYLGPLCKYKHEWADTGQSARHISSRKCAKCLLIRKNTEKRRTMTRKNKSKNRNKKAAECRAVLGDKYIENLLSNQFQMQYHEITQELIEEKRDIMLTNRKLKDIKKWEHANKI